jgi:serine/threonine protein phosphatase PrpC
VNCPHCAEPLADGAAFCEACGKPVGGAAPAAAAPVDVSQEASPFEMTAATRGPGARAAATEGGPRPCFQCGATVGPDGYCESCGTKQPTERDHFREQPVPSVAGVCDRGIRHSRNEDALALFATSSQGSERAVLVVLDGVSNTDDSHIASLAGAKAARDALLTPLPSGMGTDESRNAAVKRVFAESVQAAQKAIVALTPAGSTKPPSATYVVGVLESAANGTRLHVANIGDSRAYWLPDASTGKPGVQLSVDDSVAQAQMAAGMDRKAAEEGPQGHAIVRWLGIDAPDLVPHVTEVLLTDPGWVLVCSDGLWNYASEASALADQVAQAATSDPMSLAVALVAFANGCGGMDNITVAVARVDPPAAAGQNAATTTSSEATVPTEGAPTDG